MGRRRGRSGGMRGRSPHVLLHGQPTPRPASRRGARGLRRSWALAVARGGVGKLRALPRRPRCLCGPSPGALTSRYQETTIAQPGKSWPWVAVQAVSNYLHDSNLWHWATSGDPAPYIHVYGYGSLFLAVVLLAIAGVVLVLRERRDDLWWRYVLVATLLVPDPGGVDSRPLQRHPARGGARVRPRSRRPCSARAPDERSARMGTARGHRGFGLARCLPVRSVPPRVPLPRPRAHGPLRRRCGRTLARGLRGGRTLYIDYDDRGAQAQALWHATEDGIGRSRVVILADGGIPPPGSIVFERFQECDYVCTKFAYWEGYWLARAVGPKPAAGR